MRFPRFGGAIYAVDFDTIGLDIAKPVFQVHGVDATGQVAASAVEAPARLGILPETAAMHGGYRGVRFIAPLIPRTAGEGAIFRPIPE